MMRSFLIIIFIVFTAFGTFGQNKTYFGVEAAVTNDFYHMSDNRGSLRKHVPLVSGMGGINVRHEFHKNLFFELAVLRTEYEVGFGFRNAAWGMYGSGNSIDAWIIPLRFGKKFNLVKEKLFLVPVIGYAVCINSDYGFDAGQGPDGTGSGSQGLANGQQATYTETISDSFSKTFPLVQTGVGIEFKFHKSALFSLSMNYYSGFRKVIQDKISYSIDNSTSQTAIDVSKGQMLSISAGLKYAISNLWKPHTL
jgi:hypothetical protein